MFGYRAFVFSAVFLLLIFTGYEQPARAVELLKYPDLPPGVLYPSGVGDLNPAWIQPVTGDLLNLAYEGVEYLRVKTGTVQNGGQTFGGVVFAMPDTFVNMPVPHFYRLSFALKGDNPFVSPIFDVHISNQDGNGDANTLSHTVTTDAGWLLYEYETTLNGAELPGGWLNVPRNQLFLWTDPINGGPGQTFAIDAVRLEAFSAGDFDFDLDVDGADFLAWQRGESNDPLSTSDLADWKTYYGSVVPLTAAAAVPEPTTVWIALVLGVIGACASPFNRGSLPRMNNL